MKAAIKAFLGWAVQVSHGPNGKPSSQRVAGLLTITTLQGVFIGAAIMLIKRGQVEGFLRLFDSNALLCAGLLGLITVSKFGKAKPKESEQ